MRVPRIKICGIRNHGDLNAAVTGAPDAVGFLVGRVHVSPDFIPVRMACELAAQIPPETSPVLVTHLNNPGELEQLVQITGILTIQLHGGPTPEQVCGFRDRIGAEAVLILAVHVGVSRIEPGWKAALPWIDAVVFDTTDRASNRIGGTGMVHDWSVSAESARDCPVPVLLAGGLTPENVEEAVRTVHPFGVDVNTGVEKSDGAKSKVRCRSFVHRARQALEAGPSLKKTA